jgi:predicted amidohydrolase
MSELACPVCDVTREPAARVGNVAICGSCGSSLVVNPDGTVTRATAQHTAVLGPTDLQLLTKARAAIVRGDRRRR